MMAAAPTGNLTFRFTDIGGSRRLPRAAAGQEALGDEAVRICMANRAEGGPSRGRLVVAVTVIIVAWWVLSAPASAHSALAASSPADGEVVDAPVDRITFTFATAVEPFVDGFGLVDPDGASLPIASVEQPDPTTVVVVPAAPIEVSVEATWAIVSGDSHPVTGVIVFGVEVPAVPTTSTTTTAAPTTSIDEAATTSTTSTTSTTTTVAAGAVDATGGGPGRDVEEQMAILRDRSADESPSPTGLVAGVIRWVNYAATAAVLGGATVALVGAARGIPVWESARPWLWVAVAVLGASATLTVGGQLAELTGEATKVFAVADWGDVFEGRFRTGVLVRLAGTALAVVALCATGRRRTGLFAIGATAILASYPILGHTTDGSAWIATPATMVHVAAVSIWVGGLATVLVVGTRASRASFVSIARTFSQLAGGALAATAVAGVGLTVVQLDAVSELWETAYGQRLSVKVALVATVAAVGALHHYRTVPSLDSGGHTATARFNRLAVVEMIGFAAVLAITVWIVVAAD